LGWLDEQSRSLVKQYLGLGCEVLTKAELRRTTGLSPYKLDKALHRARYAMMWPSERSRLLRPYDPFGEREVE
jgi:hypothetical protein